MQVRSGHSEPLTRLLLFSRRARARFAIFVIDMADTALDFHYMSDNELLSATQPIEQSEMAEDFVDISDSVLLSGTQLTEPFQGSDVSGMDLVAMTDILQAVMFRIDRSMRPFNRGFGLPESYDLRSRF